MNWASIKRVLSKPLSKLLFLSIAFLALLINFSAFTLSGGRNSLVGGEKFKTFQEYSEALVYGKIFAETNNPAEHKAGLYAVSDNSRDWVIASELNEYLSNTEAQNSLSLSNYKAQTGLQGFVFGFLFCKLHIPLSVLRFGNALLLAIVLIAILYFASKRFGFVASFVSFFCFLLSPWICAFAKNLYWVEFTWFLPILCSFLLCTKKQTLIPLVMIFLTVILKCLCGFEFITVIIATTSLIPLVDYLANKSSSRKICAKKFILCASACLLGFITSVCIHCSALGRGNIVSGFEQFYDNTISRRILGGSSDSSSLQESLSISPFLVVLSYFDWNTDIITGIPGCAFGLIVMISAAVLLCSVILGRENAKSKILVFLLLFFANTSWFFLASPHSYIHKHMNFVLWYFGFIQFCFFIIVDASVFILRSLGLPQDKAQTKEPKQIPSYDVEVIKEKSSDYCLCIPIINEGERIIRELKRAKRANIQKYVDIIICDGGSTDDSIEKIKALGVSVIITKTGSGKQGAQLRTGFDYALKQKYLGIVTIDGNNKDSIEDVPKFIKKLKKGYDFVQGSRFIQGGQAINTPFYRTIAVRTLHAPLISLTAGKKYTDTTNAFRAYSIRYLKHKDVKPFRDIFSSYELLAYLSVRADQLGLKTCEIPVTRAYPKKQKTPTKISPIRGNITLFSILLKNAFGAYDPLGAKK